jgi:hypothetical protein
MNIPALLVAQTIPIAGLYVAAEESAERRQLFLLCYVAVLGMFVTALACLDDVYGITQLFGYSSNDFEN